MPKFSTIPTLYNDVLQINISKLKEWGYLEPGVNSGGNLVWSMNGQETGKISFRIYCDPDPLYIELEYRYKDEPRKYKVHFTSLESNLGKGEVWYFICPHTLKICRKLYSIGGYFLHREAFKNIYYESQIRSKRMRLLDKNFGPYFRLDKTYEELHRKYFKSFYAGKPTKKFKRLMNELKAAERHSVDDIEKLLIYG